GPNDDPLVQQVLLDDRSQRRTELRREVLLVPADAPAVDHRIADRQERTHDTVEVDHPEGIILGVEPTVEVLQPKHAFVDHETAILDDLGAFQALPGIEGSNRHRLEQDDPAPFAVQGADGSRYSLEEGGVETSVLVEVGAL